MIGHFIYRTVGLRVVFCCCCYFYCFSLMSVGLSLGKLSVREL